jgi:ATP-binding cassette subfamily F protein 3
MLAWLEDWLLEFPGGILYISHDRAFLDRTATDILELDPDSKSVHRYPGNYTAYLEEKLAAREKQWQEFSDQQAEIDRLQSAVQRRKKEATYKPGGKADSDKFAKGFYTSRSAGTIKRAKTLEKRIDFLMNEGRVEKPQQSWQMKIDFGDVPGSGRDVLVLENLSVGFGDNILLENLSQVIRYGERVALVGENGTGKTTLLRTITGELPPLSGNLRLGANVHLGYMSQEQEELDPDLNALHTIRNLAAISETDARTFLSYFLFTGDEVFVPAKTLSYGERARLSLASWVMRGSNFLMLDEPINHLDIPSRARFEQALTNFEGTVLAVVHDRYFIDGFATQVWEVKDHGVVVDDKISRF